MLAMWTVATLRTASLSYRVARSGPEVLPTEELGRAPRGLRSPTARSRVRMLGGATARLVPRAINVMVLGVPVVDVVYEACARVEAAVRRPVNPSILSPEEFASASAFLDDVCRGRSVSS